MVGSGRGLVIEQLPGTAAPHPVGRRFTNSAELTRRLKPPAGGVNQRGTLTLALRRR